MSADDDYGCQRCALLEELYDQVPKTSRNYWVWTELFVRLHGTDECDGESKPDDLPVIEAQENP